MKQGKFPLQKINKVVGIRSVYSKCGRLRCFYQQQEAQRENNNKTKKKKGKEEE